MQQDLKKRVYGFIEKNPNFSKVQIVAHFHLEGASQSTIYRHIASFHKNEPIERKPGSGRPPQIASKSTIQKLKKMFNNRSGCSQNRAARAIGCSQAYICKMLKHKSGIRKQKKQKIPNRSSQQKQAARPKCRQMTENYRGYEFVMDDESYFTLSNSTLAGNDIFYTDNIQNVPENVRYKKQSKFEKKVMVWVAISSKGMTDAYHVPAGLAINQHVYREECLSKRLLPFLRKKHSRDKFVFWPDLASSHYAKSVQTWLDEHKIEYVPRHLNPANLPEVRPIEDFWAYLKSLVYAEDYQAKTIPELIARIKKCLKNVDLNFVQRLAADTYPRLDRVRREGLQV